MKKVRTLFIEFIQAAALSLIMTFFLTILSGIIEKKFLGMLVISIPMGIAVMLSKRFILGFIAEKEKIKRQA